MANYVVNGGLAGLTSLMSSEITWLGVGTSLTLPGGSGPAKTDTALGAEVTDGGLAKGAATVTRTTTTVSNDTLSLAKTWTVSGSKSLAEYGMFKSDGTFYAHGLLSSVKSVVSGDSFTLTATIVTTN